jgi:hypothetical protein
MLRGEVQRALRARAADKFALQDVEDPTTEGQVGQMSGERRIASNHVALRGAKGGHAVRDALDGIRKQVSEHPSQLLEGLSITGSYAGEVRVDLA